MTVPSTAGDPVVALRDVCMVFGDRNRQVVALDHASLTVHPNEIVALLGPSGCGKSTTLRIIAGLTQQTSGSLHVASADNGTRGMSMMFQTPALLDWRTVRGNVTLPLEMAGFTRADAVREADRLLKTVGLEGFAGHRPFELSGGMQQRVAIARALISDPLLLLLDEPFGALDAITRDQMCIELSTICASRPISVILVTHSIPEAIYLADRIYVMSARPGRIVREVTVPMARPRPVDDRSSPVWTTLEAELRAALVHQPRGSL
jgi:NitT/TauT family transport system ATP-binding protein